jgi:hypothetical protein
MPGENHFLMKVVNGGGPTGFAYELKGLPLSKDLLEAVAAEPEALTEEQLEALRLHHARVEWAPGAERVERLATARAELADVQAEIPTVMGMGDLPDGRMTYVLDRGQYDAPDESRPVEPGVPSFLNPMGDELPRNRLGLARWLVDPEHPLTARVAVNRLWAMLFGTGLVDTVMDFGAQGSWPSHPELLDWLARDFVDHGWDVKRTMRQMVPSAAYRQSSRRRPEVDTLDPENRLLARSPRFRLQGEFIRDQALAVSGLLVDEVGGPGVKPYQPEGLWNEVSLDKNVRFEQGSGDDLYRKSMYIYWKRSAPMPAMTTFDAPTREMCVVQRQRTNTPLQALVTLNDVQFVEAARHLAERMMASGSTFEEQLDAGFVLCTGRPADAERTRILREVFDATLADYRAAPDEAAALLAVGESRRNEHLPKPLHATWTVVASVLLNLDETLNRE